MLATAHFGVNCFVGFDADAWPKSDNATLQAFEPDQTFCLCRASPAYLSPCRKFDDVGGIQLLFGNSALKHQTAQFRVHAVFKVYSNQARETTLNPTDQIRGLNTKVPEKLGTSSAAGV